MTGVEHVYYTSPSKHLIHVYNIDLYYTYRSRHIIHDVGCIRVLYV